VFRSQENVDIPIVNGSTIAQNNQKSAATLIFAASLPFDPKLKNWLPNIA
jgi:hypothetical protein